MPYIKEATESKEKGNQCMKDGKYTEAIIRYTQSIKFDSSNHLVYSNRSLAFLKEQQYFLALEDAEKCIQLQPKWPKGYFRKGEIEFQTGHFSEALLSYQHALSLDTSDEGIKSAVIKAKNELQRTQKADAKVPWSFAGIGILLGLVIVLGDEFLAPQPTMSHFIVKIAFVGICGTLGALAAKAYRYINENEKKSLLEPPPDLFGESKQKDTKQSGSRSRNSSQSSDGKASARMRKSSKTTDI